MAEFRTITIGASVSPNISVNATLTVDRPGVTAVATAADKIVTASATVSGSAVGASASIADRTVDAVAEIATRIIGGDIPAYGGPYVVTPTRETQTLMTKERAMTANVIINPIPSNYGLITWNGSSLTVS